MLLQTFWKLLLTILLDLNYARIFSLQARVVINTCSDFTLSIRQFQYVNIKAFTTNRSRTVSAKLILLPDHIFISYSFDLKGKFYGVSAGDGNANSKSPISHYYKMYQTSKRHDMEMTLKYTKQISISTTLILWKMAYLGSIIISQSEGCLLQPGACRSCSTTDNFIYAL